MDAGRPEEAAEVVARVNLDRVMRDWLGLEVTSQVAELAATLGDEALCADVVERLAPHADGHVTIGHSAYTGPVAAFLGPALARLGRTEEAEAQLVAADARCEPMQARPRQALVRADLADVVADPARAAELREDAARTAQALGMQGLAVRLEGVLRRGASSGAA